MPGGKCVFNSSWTQEKDFQQWLAPVKGDKHSAYCKLCSRQFNIGNMGKSALKSHMNGKTHQIHIKEQENSIQDFFNTACLPTSSESTNSSLTVSSSSIAHTADTGTAPTTSNSADHENQSSLHHLSTVSKKVTDAEILWALNCVNSHFSASSNVGINALFKRMFNDSEIVSLYSMSESK